MERRLRDRFGRWWRTNDHWFVLAYVAAVGWAGCTADEMVRARGRGPADEILGGAAMMAVAAAAWLLAGVVAPRVVRVLARLLAACVVRSRGSARGGPGRAPGR